MAIAGGVGAEVELDALVEARGCSGETALFGEGPGGFLVAGDRAELEALAAESGDVDVWIVGEAGGDRIALSAAEAEADVALADAARAWRSLGERVERAPIADARRGFGTSGRPNAQVVAVRLPAWNATLDRRATRRPRPTSRRRVRPGRHRHP